MLKIGCCVWLSSDAGWKHAKWREEVHCNTRLPPSHNSRFLADGISTGKLHYSHDYQGRRRRKGSDFLILYVLKQLHHIRCLYCKVVRPVMHQPLRFVPSVSLITAHMHLLHIHMAGAHRCSFLFSSKIDKLITARFARYVIISFVHKLRRLRARLLVTQVP